MRIKAGRAAVCCLMSCVTPALAGSASTTTPSPMLGDTLMFEITPEWGTAAPHAYKDSYARIGFSHSLGNGFSMGVSITDVIRAAGASTASSEAGMMYRLKQDAFTFGIGGSLGYSSDSAAELYYVATGLADVKLDDKWTWNIVNMRYRSSFAHVWVTPRVTTGLSYQIDARQTTSVAFGYSWKNVGEGLNPDKLGVSLGYRLGF